MEQEIKEIVKSISKIQSQNTTNPCSISQVAAKHALKNEKIFLKDWLKKFEDRRDLLVNFFQSKKDLIPSFPLGLLFICELSGLFGNNCE